MHLSLISFVALFVQVSSRENVLTSLSNKVWIQTRRILNFSSLFGSPTDALPYDRIASHPVFCVTTPWGSPYMTMEKLSDLDEVVKADASTSGKGSPQSISEEQSEVRTVAVFFMDPDDAVALHGEMKQMEQLEKTDIRVTSFSLAKALRQSSNLGNGLVTGLPPDALDGNLHIDQGASLRYKIVPPKRQLYYASRCIGKERVGLFGDSPSEDAQTAVMGNSALEAMNLVRRREKRERKAPSKQKTPMQAKNSHMEGYTGIPVFYCSELRRVLPLHKRLISGNRHEIPLFFNYEDLQETWKTLQSRYKDTPDSPSQVEVFNLWDVLTSMDRAPKSKDPWRPLKKRFAKAAAPDLSDITFVPSSRAIQYKEATSARGNGKARLRPMREW